MYNDFFLHRLNQKRDVFRFSTSLSTNSSPAPKMLNIVSHEPSDLPYGCFRIFEVQHTHGCLLRTALRRTGPLLNGLLVALFGVCGTQSRDVGVQPFSLLLDARMLHRRVEVPDRTYGSESTSDVERLSVHS
jgi:hypothetical protein